MNGDGIKNKILGISWRNNKNKGKVSISIFIYILTMIETFVKRQKNIYFLISIQKKI